MFFVGAARNALGRIDWERSDCAAPSMVEGGPRLHERPLLMRRIDGVGNAEPDGSDACFLSHPRQGAGVRPNSNLFGFWVPLIFPCTLN